MEDKISAINYIPKNRWMDYGSMRPGPQGSVGDVVMMTRLKHSSMDVPMRYDSMTAHGKEPRVGSNVQDGYVNNYRGNGGARTFYDALVNADKFNNRGFKHQDVWESDKLVVPVDVGIPSYQWKNKMAENYEAKRTGDKFLPFPGEYVLPPGQVARGPMPVSTPLVDNVNSGVPSYTARVVGLGGNFKQ